MKKLFYVGALLSLLLAAFVDSEIPEKNLGKESNEEVWEVNEHESLSEAQIATVEAFKSNDFKTFADAFYALPAPERSDIYSSDIEQQFVTWTDIITDLVSISDSVVMFGDESLYTGVIGLHSNKNYQILHLIQLL